MNTRERFHAAMNFQPFDRLPMIEWASWWDKTIARWHTEGLPPILTDRYLICQHFGLDLYYQDWIAPRCPRPAWHGGPLVQSVADYKDLSASLYPPDAVNLKRWEEIAPQQQAGDAVLWFTLNGFFWYPRVSFGIEPHLYAFYDQPDLMNRINEDLLAYNLRIIDQICTLCTPDFMTFAEDMSYNHGPMLSEELFAQFIAPFYRRIVPELHRRGIKVIVDSDGDITVPAAWFQEVGVDGILPLERQAGVDITALRRHYPRMQFIGHYDKMVMNKGQQAIQGEFDRLLLPAARGGFLPSVDHQTPPGVSYPQYLDYLKCYKEFAAQAGALSQTHALRHSRAQEEK